MAVSAERPLVPGPMQRVPGRFERGTVPDTCKPQAPSQWVVYPLNTTQHPHGPCVGVSYRIMMQHMVLVEAAVFYTGITFFCSPRRGSTVVSIIRSLLR